MRNSGGSFAYRVDRAGGATRLELATAESETGWDLLWIHLDLNEGQSDAWLARAEIPEIVVEALAAEETRPRVARIEDGLLVILRGVNQNPGADPEDMVSLRIWAEAGRVVTAGIRPTAAVADIRAEVEAGRGPRESADLLAEIADRMIERMAGVLDGLDDAIDEMNEAESDLDLTERRATLVSVRRQAISLRRYLAPQREALARLHNERVSWISESQRLQFREVTDATIRYVEDLEASRERTAAAQEEINSQLSEQLNRRMYALSMVAGIFLPLGFLTGLLGINVAGMPGSENPDAFAWVCGGLIVLGIGQVLLLRRLRWF